MATAMTASACQKRRWECLHLSMLPQCRVLQSTWCANYRLVCSIHIWVWLACWIPFSHSSPMSYSVTRGCAMLSHILMMVTRMQLYCSLFCMCTHSCSPHNVIHSFSYVVGQPLTGWECCWDVWPWGYSSNSLVFMECVPHMPFVEATSLSVKLL